jgi:hypothetical protein
MDARSGYRFLHVLPIRSVSGGMLVPSH